MLHVKAYVERVQFTEIVLLHDDSLWILDSFTIKCIQQTQKKKKNIKIYGIIKLKREEKKNSKNHVKFFFNNFNPQL